MEDEKLGELEGLAPKALIPNGFYLFHLFKCFV